MTLTVLYKYINWVVDKLLVLALVTNYIANYSNNSNSNNSNNNNNNSNNNNNNSNNNNNNLYK